MDSLQDFEVTLQKALKQEESIFIRLMRDSTIHGVKYIVMPNRPIGERIFWITIILISAGSAAFLIYGVLDKYRANPVIVSFQPKQTSILNVPFPAVTICSENKFKKSHFEKALKVVLEGVESGHSEETVTENRILLRQLEHLCSQSTTFTTRFNYSINGTTVNICERLGNNLTGCENSTNTNPGEGSFFINKPFPIKVVIKLFNAIQSCDDLVQLCLFEGEKQNCSNMFRRLPTDMGFCCTFNMMPSHILLKNTTRMPEITDEEDAAWRKFNLDEILELKDKEDSGTPNHLQFPKYQSKAGQASGLSFLLNPSLEEYFCGSDNGFGFKVFAHSPIEYPHPNDFGVAVGPRIEQFMSVYADVTRSEKEIRDLPIGKRKCYYSDEHELAMITKYTSTNCVDSCIADKIRTACGCVRFDMPLRSNDPTWENVTYCEMVNQKCMRKETSKVVKTGTQKLCPKCLHSCNRIEYVAQTSSLPLRNDFRIEGYNISRNSSIVHVFFGSDNIYSRIRKNIYSFNDMFAHVGAILGVLLGMSVLSIVEPINYFFRKYGNNGSDKIERLNSADSTTSRSDLIPNAKIKKKLKIRRIQVASASSEANEPRNAFGTQYSNKIGWQTKYMGDVADGSPFEYRMNRF